MDHGFHSKRAHHDRLPRAAFDNPCSGSCFPEREPAASFRSAENSSEAVAGNITPIVHTAPAFGPTAQQAAT
jgi:hypothetical protein